MAALFNYGTELGMTDAANPVARSGDSNVGIIYLVEVRKGNKSRVVVS